MYTPTAPIPNPSQDKVNEAAFVASDAACKVLQGLVRNDADRDALETAIGDAIYNVATGKFTCFDAGQDDHYDAEGNCL